MTMQSGVPAPPANWYPSPEGPHLMRYWDGRAWTEHTAPASSPAYAPQPQQFHSTGPMTSAGMNVNREVIYNRQQTGHSLTLWIILSVFLVIPAIGLIYYSVSPNHYWHA